jgi:DNA-binding NarL/FixJ family response regulator
VLTTSAAETDIAQSYRLHANSYFTKPAGFEEIDGLVRCLNKFWLEKAKLP